MRTAVEIALKDLRLLVRDPAGLFWVVGFPILFALLFSTVLGAAMSGELSGVPITVVDEDRSERSERLLRVMEAIDAIRVQELPAPESARDAVRRSEAVAYVLIPAGYGDATPSPSHLEIRFDASRRTEASVVHSIVSEAERVADGLADVVHADGASAPGVTDEEPAVVNALFASIAAARGPELLPISGGRDRSGMEMVFGAAVLWGLMGCAAVFSISMVTERTAGTLLRLRAAPISRASILGGKALACFVASVADAAVLITLGVLVLDVQIGQVAALGAAIAAAAFCFSGVTMALSVIGRSEQAVAGAGWSVLIIFAMLGGAMVPLSLMPESMQALSDFSPVKWGIFALEGAMWRELSWAEMAHPLLALVVMGLVGFGIGLGQMARTGEVGR